MNAQIIKPKNHQEHNDLVNHPLQSYEWGEFRRKTGITVIRETFQLTIHLIPHTPWTVGYLPKGNLPTKELIEDLRKIGRKQNCIFIQLEPNIKNNPQFLVLISKLGLRPSARALFTQYTFVLDLTKTEEELLKNMHHKTRYNIRLAKKHNVVVKEDNSKEAFEAYVKLTQETTKRQKFYAHSESYHRIQWQTLKHEPLKNELTSHLLVGRYQNKILAAWILFVFKDTLYYPYGASSNEHREVMVSNLMMWEAIKFGKKLGLSKLDMWGALGSNPDPSDEWYGFHRFKQGYGPEHIEFVGSYDLIINPVLYLIYIVANKLRWFLLSLKS